MELAIRELSQLEGEHLNRPKPRPWKIPSVPLEVAGLSLGVELWVHIFALRSTVTPRWLKTCFDALFAAFQPQDVSFVTKEARNFGVAPHFAANPRRPYLTLFLVLRYRGGHTGRSNLGP